VRKRERLIGVRDLWIADKGRELFAGREGEQREDGAEIILERNREREERRRKCREL
jgi:hypothetical protein